MLECKINFKFIRLHFKCEKPLKFLKVETSDKLRLLDEGPYWDFMEKNFLTDTFSFKSVDCNKKQKNKECTIQKESTKHQAKSRKIQLELLLS